MDNFSKKFIKKHLETYANYNTTTKNNEEIEKYIFEVVRKAIKSKSSKTVQKYYTYLQMIRCIEFKNFDDYGSQGTYFHSIIKVMVDLRSRDLNRTQLKYLSRLLLKMIYPEGIRIYTAECGKKDISFKNKDVNVQYPYIPYFFDSFFNIMHKYPKFSKGKKFIDIGCGIGDKSFLMKFLFPELSCYGLEYDSINIGIAQKKE